MPPDQQGLITEKEALSYMISSVVRETVSAEFKVFREYLETHLEACKARRPPWLDKDSCVGVEDNSIAGNI